ncbi:MAG: hypothetical protein QXP38_10565 [Nitrososphaerota archaeon]
MPNPDPSRGNCTNCPRYISLSPGDSTTVTLETDNTIDRIFCIDTFFKGSWLADDSTSVTIKGACYTDEDCLPKNNIKGKCDSPDGTDNPETSGYTYTCYWKPCSSNAECVDGYCCVTSAQDTNIANQGKCVSRGIYSNNHTWLCDPPEWNFEKENSSRNIFELILNFFSHFFSQR